MKKSFANQFVIVFINLFIFFFATAQTRNGYLDYTPETINKMLSNNETFHESKKMIVAPKGNKDQTGAGDLRFIPSFPTFTTLRLVAFGQNFSVYSEESRTRLADQLAKDKIPQIMQQLKQEGLLAEAVRVARKFNMDPLNILGPIIGEFTFNGYFDQALQNIAKRNSLAKSKANNTVDSDIEIMSKRMNEIIDSVEGKRCLASNISNYWKWRCVLFYNPSSRNSNGLIIDTFYSLRTNKNSDTSFHTFGIGQMQPFLMWSVSDLVFSKMADPANYRKFEITNLEKPFEIVFNNKEMLAYIAAVAANSIEVYKLFGGIDISQNPGLVTTLYNTGEEYQKAYYYGELRTNSPQPVYPQVNYLGWYINRNESLIRSYLE